MNIEKKVICVVSEQLGLPEKEINLETTKHELDMDSLDDIEVIMMLEEQFEIEIPDEDAKRVKSVKDAVALVSEIVGA